MTWAPSYATPAQLRQYIRKDAVTADADDIATDTNVHTPAVAAASRMIDTACGRQFGSVSAEDRIYTATYMKQTRRYLITVDDMMAVPVSVAVDLDGSGAFATAVTDYVKIPRNAAAKGQPWTHIELGPTASVTTSRDRYRVNDAFGWTAFPPTIVEATLMQAARLVQRRDAPFGVAGSPELGNEIRLLAKLDPDVAVMVASYRRLV